MGTPDEYCKGRGRPKTRGDDTQRSTIVETSRRLFVQKGYGATTTEDIAAACRISKQTLYRLFPSKPTLFAAVVEAGRPQWLEFPVPEDMPPQQALERIFRINISDEEDRERLELARLRLTECPSHPDLHHLITEPVTNHPLAPLACWMKRQEELGRLQLVGDAFSLARMLADMVFGAMVMNSFNDLRWPSGEARQTHIRNAISVFLHGVSAAPHA
ncbi:MAG: TetR/AcrR family transcriptional regulator [Rhodospirillales bacterium]|nr:TetR/AcrR family transcriptional regulator [Rhodospirillales bacterium]